MQVCTSKWLHDTVERGPTSQTQEDFTPRQGDEQQVPETPAAGRGAVLGNSKRRFITQLRHCFVPREQTKSISPLQTLFCTCHGLQMPCTSMHSTRAQRSHSTRVQGAEKGPAGQRPPPGQHPVTNLAAKGPQKYLSSCCPAAPKAEWSISARTWLQSRPSQQCVMKLYGASRIQGGQAGQSTRMDG